MAGSAERAGALFYRVECQKRAPIDDGLGNQVSGDFATQFTVSAGYTHMRGGEGVVAARLQRKHPMIVTVRSSSQTRQITTDWRLVDKRTGEEMAIKDVTPELNRQWISLLVEKGGSAV